jgi:RNA polymerase subunit RPABC4/transcription elongation factor Spt4
MGIIACKNCGDNFYDYRKNCPNCNFEREDGKGKEINVKSNSSNLFKTLIGIIIFLIAVYRMVRWFY